MKFQVTTEGPNKLGMAGLCQQFANDRWLPAHVSPAMAAEMVLDQFKRQIAQELELLEVRVVQQAACP